jgi:HD-like signal output (HDOD) protein/DNA-binding response OmpR family regulator
MNRPNVAAILLADIEQSAELAVKLAATKIVAEVATGCDEMYRLAYRRSVDLVIVDDRLPGFLSGIEILERLHSEALLRAATILIAERPFELAERAAKIGVSCVLRRDGDLESLVTKAKSLIVLSPNSRLDVVPEAYQVARQFDAMFLPELARKMFGYLKDESCSTSELAADVSIDPKATCGLLRITNSAALGLKCKVTSVADAVNLLGPRRAASYVLRAMLAGSQDIPAGKIDRNLVQWFRQRAVLTACVASTFATRVPDLVADTIYVHGLLQDVGILAMAQAYGRRYQRVFERMQRPGSVRLEILESREFDLTHAHVSAAVLERWGLPESFVALALCHHPQTVQMPLSTKDEQTLRVMRIGEAIANLLTSPHNQPNPYLHQFLCDNGFPGQEECRACVMEAIQKMTEASRLFSLALPNRAQMAKLVHQQFAAARGKSPAVVSSEPASPSNDLAESIALSPTGSIPTEPQPTDASDAYLLVIDDEPQFLNLVESILTPVGMKTASARSITEAVRLAPGAHAILCDVHLAGEDGRDVVRTLKQSGSKIPFIMVSGDCTRKTIEDCVNLGIDDYLIKPFSPLALLTKMEKHTGLLLSSRAKTLANPKRM